MAKLPTVEQMKFRRYPPLKSGPPILWPSHRYFRRNEGSTDYATHTSVTVDRIVMDVLPNTGNGNLGLPTGAPAVTDNVLQTIDFTYSGSISELYRNGSDYFSGIIANVKYYLAGSLIHAWSINSNTSTETDSVGGLVLTVINGNASDWGLFDRQADGDWLGQELSITGTFDSVDIGGDAVTRYDVASVFSGSSYMLSTGIRNHLGSGDVGFIGTSAGTNIPSDYRVSSDNNINFDIYVDTTSTVQLFNRSTNQCTFESPSVKEVLKNA